MKPSDPETVMTGMVVSQTIIQGSVGNIIHCRLTIVQSMVYLLVRGALDICVVCDDTDVFELLVHFYNRAKLNLV